MELVSRENLFNELPEDDTPSLNLQLEIKEVEVTPVDDAQMEEEEFCLFGGETINVADIEAPEEEEEFVSRPETYYFYYSTPETKYKCQMVALSGDMAAQWFVRESTAPDVNADYKKPKKTCRPSASARRNKRARNQRLEDEKKEELRLQRLQRSKAKRGGFRGRGRGR